MKKPLDGVSLAPLLLEDSPAWEDRLIFSYWNKKLSVRNQKYRLGNEGMLFDMQEDPGQNQDISDERPEIFTALMQAKSDWERDVLSELPEEDNRTFTIGYEGFPNTQIPARDLIAHGNIIRSNRWPNCSFYTNWTSVEDMLTLDVEVLNEGEYEVVIYYTCPAASVGSRFELSLLDSRLEGRITEAHDPPLTGMEKDRTLRPESYVKDFKPLNIGTIHLEKGMGTLKLQPLEIPGKEVMDFRLMMLKKIG